METVTVKIGIDKEANRAVIVIPEDMSWADRGIVVGFMVYADAKGAPFMEVERETNGV